MEKERLFFRVTDDPWEAPLHDYLNYGYEERMDFYHAVKKIVGRWHDREGEAVGERHEFLRLRFCDTPGGRTEEAWLPRYLLQAIPMPEYVRERERPIDPIEAEIDEAFGFD